MHLVNNIIMCHLPLVDICEVFGLYKKKGKNVKAIPLQVTTGPEDSRRLSLSDFKTIGT